MTRIAFAAVALLLFMAACTGVSPRQPVPVEERTVGGEADRPAATDRQTDGGGTADGTMSDDGGATGTDLNERAAGPAVVAMLNEADQQRLAGNHAGAASSLERALTLEPKNAYLWSRLAALRLDQGNWQQAYVLANKSNSLIRDNPELSLSNWRIIAEAQRRQGNDRAVREAEREIRRLESEE